MELLQFPSSSTDELKIFEDKISVLVLEHFGALPMAVELINSSIWSAQAKPPQTLLDVCPTSFQNTLLSTWPTLTEVQRYALYKLSISKRREETLELAFKEFFPHSIS